MSPAIIITSAYVSIVFIAFPSIASRRLVPRSHKHVYQDEDGEASTNTSKGNQDRVIRIYISVLALAALGLSVSNWVLLDFDTRFGIIASGWVRLTDF